MLKEASLDNRKPWNVVVVSCYQDDMLIIPCEHRVMQESKKIDVCGKHATMNDVKRRGV